MRLDSVSERRSRTFATDSALSGAGSAEHAQERFAVGTDASSYMPHRGVGRRAIEAAHKARGHFGGETPVVPLYVAWVRAIDPDNPHAVERSGARSRASKRREGQRGGDRHCCKAPSAKRRASQTPCVASPQSQCYAETQQTASAWTGLGEAHVADRPHQRQSASVR